MAFQTASADPFPDKNKPHECNKYAWTGQFAGIFTCMLLSHLVFVIFPGTVASFNYKYYFLDILAMSIGCTFGPPLADFLMLQQCARDNAEVVKKIPAAKKGIRASLRRMVSLCHWI